MGRSILAGLDESEIRDELERVFPGQSDRTYQAALKSGIAAYSAANIFESNNPDFPLQLGYIPPGAGRFGGLLFGVEVSGIDPNTGREFTVQLYLPFDTLPSFDEFSDTLVNVMVDRFGPKGIYPRRGFTFSADSYSQVIIGIQRNG